MNVKLDENVPAGLASLLEKHGHDVVTVPQQGLAGQPDATIWEATQGETRFLITTDLHFADIRRFPPGSHEGILVLRPARQGRRAIHALLQAVVAQQSLDMFRQCIVIADEGRIRVRRP